MNFILWEEIGKFWYYDDFVRLFTPLDQIEDLGNMMWSSLFRTLIVSLLHTVNSTVYDSDAPEPVLETAILKNLYTTLEVIAKQKNYDLEKTWNGFIELSRRTDIMKTSVGGRPPIGNPPPIVFLSQ